MVENIDNYDKAIEELEALQKDPVHKCDTCRFYKKTIIPCRSCIRFEALSDNWKPR